jgi:hypothetical protein
MDLTFLTGVAAVASAIIVFCGSVWLLLTFVMGARLAYFVVASVTLAFTLIMALVWSFTELGPVGEFPEWRPGDVAEEPAELTKVPSASSYPEGPWKPVDQEDVTQVEQAAELETTATDALQTAIDNDEVTGFESAEDATANTDATRLLEQGDSLYGGVTLEPVEGSGADPDAQAVVVMTYDFGNLYGMSRVIAGGIFVLLVLHLFGLSRSEKRARELTPRPT